MKIDFEHRQSAHCENGVAANLMNYYGFNMNEPLIYGMGSGLFFSHMPFVKVNNIPVTSFRPLPGVIFSRITRQLGIKITKKKFKDPEKAMKELDEVVEKGIPCGLLVGVYHLTYFPSPYRFHFNAHNLVVCGKENGKYIISDPIMETLETLSYDDLKRVRYAQGLFAPKGHMYFVDEAPDTIDIKSAVIGGINKTCRQMLTIPVHMFGVNGIKYMAGKIRKYPSKLGDKKAALYLGQIVRAQEEIGTGGAGFRFIYAAFLQEAAEIIGNDKLNKLSEDMTSIGDHWREFAITAARIVKNRSGERETYALASEMLLDIADKEKKLYRELKATVK